MWKEAKIRMTIVFLPETKHAGSQWNNIFKKVLKGKNLSN